MVQLLGWVLVRRIISVLRYFTTLRDPKSMHEGIRQGKSLVLTYADNASYVVFDLVFDQLDKSREHRLQRGNVAD